MSFDLSSDFFHLFGIPVSFSIDTAALMQRYRELQQVVHPDRFASSSEQERRLSMQYATHINEGLRILKDPLERARYLLQLKGVQWDDEQSTISDPEFLMQQMELRESLSEVNEQADPLVAVADIITHVDGITQKYTSMLEVLLQSGNMNDLDKAKLQVRKMQFLRKMKSEAETLEARLEDE
jgi:molecular chaperone HscB